MSRRRRLTESRRRRLAAVARLVAAASWLVLAVAFFRVPIAQAVRPMAQAAGIVHLLDLSDPGFVLRLVSVPPGGRLFVNGEDRGPAPLVTNVACRDGERVRLRVVLDGLGPWQRDIACRQGRTLSVTARLER